jgi:hypothetical protein
MRDRGKAAGRLSLKSSLFLEENAFYFRYAFNATNLSKKIKILASGFKDA